VSTTRARALLERLHAGVADLATDRDWRRYLDVAGRFHRYSWWNTVAIFCQRPDASRVAGYRVWQRLGRQVRQGERGIRILAPCTYRRLVADDASGDDTEITQLRGFKVVSVFDIAQTDGEPLPEAPQVASLDGPAPETLHHQLAALIRAEGFRFVLGTLPGRNASAMGVTDFGSRTVTVRNTLAGAQRAKTTAHELAHVLLHAPGQPAIGKARREIEAESVAYVVLAAMSVDAGTYSFGYVTAWAGGDTAVVQATGERVLECARLVLDRLGASHGDAGRPAA